MKTKISLVTGFLSSFCLISFNLLADNSAIENPPTVTETTTLSERFSDKVINRPGIMPVGIFNLETGFTMRDVKSNDFTSNLNITSQFGIVKGLHGEVSYDGAYPYPSSATKRASNKIALATKYNYLSLSHMSFSASAKLPMHVMSNNEIVRDVTIGLPVVFYNDVMAGSIFGDLLTLTMRPKVAVDLDFPFWYGVQVYGKLWAMVDSSFGSVNMINDDNQATWKATPFWKKLPATLALTYVINHYIDVGASFGFSDTLKADETLKFGVNFAVRGGSIFG